MNDIYRIFLQIQYKPLKWNLMTGIAGKWLICAGQSCDTYLNTGHCAE